MPLSVMIALLEPLALLKCSEGTLRFLRQAISAQSGDP